MPHRDQSGLPESQVAQGLLRRDSVIWRYLDLAMQTHSMPAPGDISPGFIAEANRCWRMVYDRICRRTTAPSRPLDGTLALPEG